MNIKGLIKELKQYKNQEAKVLITLGNEDSDTLSTSDFQCFSDTSETHEYIEIFIHEDKCSRQA